MKNKTWLITSLFATGTLFLTGCSVSFLEFQANSENNPRRINDMLRMADIYRGKFVMCDTGPVFIGLPEPDDKKVLEWLEKAAEAGSKEACFEAGTMYAEGIGTTKNERVSAAYMEKAFIMYSRASNDYLPKFTSWLQTHKVNPILFKKVIRQTLEGLEELEQQHRNGVYKKEAQKITELYVNDVLAMKDNGINPYIDLDDGIKPYSEYAIYISDSHKKVNVKHELLSYLKAYNNLVADEYNKMDTKYKELAKQEKEARKKAEIKKQEQLHLQREEATSYKGRNKIPFVGDITSGTAYSVGNEKKIKRSYFPQKAEDQKFFLGYITKASNYKIYWGCVNEKIFEYDFPKHSGTEAYAFALIRSFNDVTMNEVVEAAQKKYPGLKRTDKRLRAEAIIRGTVYKATYTLPQVILENDKMKIVIQQVDSTSLPDAAVQRMESGEELYKRSLEDGKTYAVRAQDAVDLFQASKKVTDPVAVAFIEMKRSARDLAEQLKKYGCVKDLYASSNNPFYKNYADKFSRAALIPMFSVSNTLENRMILQNKISKDASGEEQGIIFAAFDNALSQYFDRITRGGTNRFVMTIYDKAMWLPVKQYYIQHLQKEKEKEQEEKRKELSL